MPTSSAGSHASANKAVSRSEHVIMRVLSCGGVWRCRLTSLYSKYTSYKKPFSFLFYPSLAHPHHLPIMSRQDFLFNSSTPPNPLQQPAADNLHKDDEMDQCRLPTEVCERIIDFTSYGRSRFHFPSYLGDLRACALTCRKWLPRSRLNLYRCVWFQERRNLERVSQAIANHPFLAEFVQELILGNPNPGCASHRTHDPGSIAFKFFRAELVQELISGNPALISLEEPRKDQYIPFASDTLVRALQNVRVLTLSHFHWHALHPRYHETAAQYSIVELNIIGGCFNTFPDLLRVVWAFHHLRTLRLIDVKFERMSNTNLESIAQKRPTLCHELIDLHVVGVSHYHSCHAQLNVHRNTSRYRFFSFLGRASFRADVSVRT